MNHASPDWTIPRAFLSENEDSKWTHCPEPFNDESFSSWFVRLAKENCADPLPLYYSLMGKQRPFKDIEHDINVKTSLKKALATFIDIESINFSVIQLSTAQGERKVIGEEYLNSYLNFPRYCPLCLMENDLYFRHIWQLPFVCICPVHHNLLLDRCPSCYNPIQYWRTRWNQPICLCFKCGENLMKNYRFLSSPRNHADLRFQDAFLEICERGSYKGEKIKTNLFFKNLWMLAVNECPAIKKEEPLSGLTVEILFHGLQLAFKKFIENPETFYAFQVNNANKHVKTEAIEIKRDQHDRKPLSNITESELEVAEYRYQIIMAYINSSNKTTGDARRRAEEAGISLTTFYRWLQVYKEAGYMALAPRRSLSGRHRNKFSQEIESIMTVKIKNNIIRSDPVSKQQCWEDFTELLSQLGYEPAEIPGKNTFRNRYLEIMDEIG